MSDPRPLDLDALAKLEAAARPGPWRVTSCLDCWVTAAEPNAEVDDQEPLIAHCGDIDWPDSQSKQREWEGNAEFIAAFRNAAPALIAELASLRASVAKAAEALEEIDRKRTSCRGADHFECAVIFGACLEIAVTALRSLRSAPLGDKPEARDTP